MPRGKTKATVASAPPMSPPPAKKRRTASSTVNGTVNISGAAGDDGNAQKKRTKGARNDGT